MSHHASLFTHHSDVQGDLFTPPADTPHAAAEDGADETPAQQWDREATKRALDELFGLALQYRSSAAYNELLTFIGRFRFYSPFNAMLVHIQMPGARFVAPPSRWLKKHHRRIKAGAHPLVILQPMGPVMFIFDVSDTEGEPLPPQVENPFAVRRGRIRHELTHTIENAKRDGVRVHTRKLGSQQGGSIRTVGSRPGHTVRFGDMEVRVRYELELNEDSKPEVRYATLVHELGHLYCGHIGTPDEKWWPDRRGLPHPVMEFEAESIAYLLCARLKIDNPSEHYLASFVRSHEEVPPISLDCVMKAAGLIERMAGARLKSRKRSNASSRGARDKEPPMTA